MGLMDRQDHPGHLANLDSKENRENKDILENEEIPVEEENQVALDQEVSQDPWEIKVQGALKVRADLLDNVGSPDLWDQWVNLVEIVIMAKLRKYALQ